LKDINSVETEKYEGQTSKGVKHGHGSQGYPLTGEIYKGSFKQDMRHGNGLCVSRKTGVIYRGEFRENNMNGHGIIYCPPGEIIEGTFLNGFLNDGKVKILVRLKAYQYLLFLVFQWRVL